jgi:hypothetical protein
LFVFWKRGRREQVERRESVSVVDYDDDDDALEKPTLLLPLSLPIFSALLSFPLLTCCVSDRTLGPVFDVREGREVGNEAA